MSDGIVTRFTGTLSLLLLLFVEGYSQEAAKPPVRLMFYNVENLFDTSNDTLTEDDEFLPLGLRRWNSRRYYSKISSVFKAIVAAGEWHPPAIIGLCEVENRKVLEDLVYGTNLSRYNYGIVHKDSPDPRGIDVCLIYLKDVATIVSYRYLVPADAGSDKFETRSVLYAKFLITDDTLHLFVNHWPSRRGGVLAGEDQRLSIARMVKSKADSIASASDGKAAIIIMGDFNSTPDDNVLNQLSGTYSSGLPMVNLAADIPSQTGSYRYMGTWEMIDQVIVSEMLVKNEGGLLKEPALFKVFRPSFLLMNDPVYPGLSPFPTYRGYRYQGGFSDHLPVLLDLNFR
jgi:predicted extracellular nuclease